MIKLNVKKKKVVARKAKDIAKEHDASRTNKKPINNISTTTAQNSINDEISQFVADSMAAGTYFRDGLRWYAGHYLGPIFERTILLFISIVGIVITYELIATVNNLLPLKKSIPFAIHSTDQTKYFPVMRKLHSLDKSSDDNLNEALLSYLIVNYINLREVFKQNSGDVEQLNQRFKYVKNNSTRDEFRNFQDKMSLNNRNSPLNIYGTQMTQEVKVASVEFTRNKKSFFNLFDDVSPDIVPEGAKAKLLVTIYDAQRQVIMQKNQKAEIKFSFKPITFNKNTKTFLPLNFIVTDYKVMDI